MKNLILLNMSHKFDWDNGVANRNYHIYRTIQASGQFEKILCVDFLPFTLKKRLKVWLKGKLYAKNANTVFYNGSSRVDSDPEHEGTYWMTALQLDGLHKAMKELGMEEEETVLWSYNPFTSQVIEDFKGFTVFDAVDNWIDHPSYTEYKETLEQHYTTIRKKSDVIFTVSEGLVDFFEKKDNVYYIPNGVDAQHFSPVKKNEAPAELKDRSRRRPLIGYHGVIQDRVNFTILHYLAKENPKWDFAIVGPVWDEVKKDMNELSKLDNVYATGAVSYEDLPRYIQEFSVAIIPHKVDRFTQSMNPLKMYEYLAAGKPIVSTAVAGAQQFEDYITLAVSPDDFLTGIKEALATKDEELPERRMTAAAAHSWESRAAVMLKTVARGVADSAKNEEK